MKKINVIGRSVAHEGEADKPNEDAWRADIERGTVAIADGITRSRLSDGTYPSKDAIIASHSFVEATIAEFFASNTYNIGKVKRAIAAANGIIALENKERGITPASVDYKTMDYLGTTGCVACLNPIEKTAIMAYVGDVIVMHFPEKGRPRLLTRDQLHGCHQFSYRHFPKDKNEERVLWQRKEARNKITARDPNGNPVGFGAFTGEIEALDFLEVIEVPIEKGDRFLFASDALRILANVSKPNHQLENIFSYTAVTRAAQKITFERWPDYFISMIRQREKDQKARSDDATIVVAEVL